MQQVRHDAGVGIAAECVPYIVKHLFALLEERWSVGGWCCAATCLACGLLQTEQWLELLTRVPQLQLADAGGWCCQSVRC